MKLIFLAYSLHSYGYMRHMNISFKWIWMAFSDTLHFHKQLKQSTTDERRSAWNFDSDPATRG